MVTVFSAADYCGEFDNDGAVMCVDETLMCSFKKIKQEKIKKLGMASKKTNGTSSPGGYGSKKMGSKFSK